MKKHQNIPKWLQEARNKWQYVGKERPPFAATPKKGQRSVWDFPRPPAIEKESREIIVRYNSIALATTRNALAILETASPPTFYIPPSAVHRDQLQAITGRSSFCEWKGKAVYWALRSSQDLIVGWSYPNPLEPYALLRDHIAFYPQKLECSLGGERVQPQPGLFYAGWITSDLSGPFKGEPGTGHW